MNENVDESLRESEMENVGGSVRMRSAYREYRFFRRKISVGTDPASCSA